MQITQPAFELESYEDTSLPHGERLTNEDQLKGHTVKAVVDHLQGRLGHQAEMVIITETLCWLVLDTSNNYCSEEKAGIEVRQCHGGRFSHTRKSTTPVETLHDYLGADVMFRYGLVSAGQHIALLAIEAAAEQKENQEKASLLRKQLSELEGGAA